jgi:hypothetical protein
MQHHIPKDILFNFMLGLLLVFVLLQLKHNMQNVKCKTSAVSVHAGEAAIFFILAKSQMVKHASFAMYASVV